MKIEITKAPNRKWYRDKKGQQFTVLKSSDTFQAHCVSELGAIEMWIDYNHCKEVKE